jgi:dimethylamine monooxygenase subunit A
MGTFGCPFAFLSPALSPVSSMSFDFDHAVQAPFRMQPGLRRLAPGSVQLTPNHLGARHLREKLAVLFNWADQALLREPGFDPAPALAALAAQAQAEHPSCFQAGRHGGWHALALGWAVDAHGKVCSGGKGWPEIGACLNRLPTEWRQAGLMALAFAEDFAIVDGAKATLPWLAVCLPSHWSPQEKIGRHFSEIHQPVADNALLLKAGEHLMRLVSGEARWERFVWNISRHPRLHTHPLRVDPQPWATDLSPDALAETAWFRTERQTFIPLPQHRQAVFTILVDSRPLARALATPAHAARLRDAVASMSPAVLAYRGIGTAQARLVDWLSQRAGALAPATA